MDLTVRAPHCDLKTPDREYAEEKIGAAVQKVLGRHTVHVDVEITDLANGTGAPQKRVSVHVRIPHSKTEVVAVEDAEIRAAIDLAADRVLRAVKRNVQRRRSRRGANSKEMAAYQPPQDETQEFEGTPPPA